MRGAILWYQPAGLCCPCFLKDTRPCHHLSYRLPSVLSQVSPIPSASSIPGHSTGSTRSRQIDRIRVAFYPILIFLGLIETWYFRHRVFSDGVSYIEIARRYLNGDSAHAVNAY